MEKSEITISFDCERLEALEFYLGKEHSSVQKRMEEALRQLYEQAVPEPMREFLDRKAAPVRPKRPTRPSQPKQEPRPVAPLAQKEDARNEQ